MPSLSPPFLITFLKHPNSSTPTNVYWADCPSPEQFTDSQMCSSTKCRIRRYRSLPDSRMEETGTRAIFVLRAFYKKKGDLRYENCKLKLKIT